MKKTIMTFLLALASPVSGCGRAPAKGASDPQTAAGGEPVGAGSPSPTPAPQAAFVDLGAHPAAPTDVVLWKGKLVATELNNNRLAIYDDATFTHPTYLVGQGFHAPHFLAVAPDGGLLVSNGWGSSLVEVQDLDGSGWQEYAGDARGFDAPHGVCVSSDGWIYVADNLHSRLVRFRDMTGADFEEFSDAGHVIAYVRQLQCVGTELWASNSYETIAGLNPGDGGSNVLAIAEFASGKATEVYHAPASNMTGVQVVGAQVYFGLWAGNAVYRMQTDGSGLVPVEFPKALGVPYGIEQIGGQVYLVSFGTLDGQNPGGVSRLSQP